MSIEQAIALMNRAATDPEFLARLNETPVDQKRAVLVAEGYGDVKIAHLSQAIPASLGGELSDEEFAAVAGGGSTATTLTVVYSEMSASVVAGAAGAAGAT
jgi:predicted ribosomally synthesized peptide with nif11-like leader